MSNTEQATLQSPPNQQPQLGDASEAEKTELREKLEAVDITSARCDALVDEFGSLEKLLNATDQAITNTDQIGSSTLETIRRELDPSYGKDYTVVKQGDGYVFSEWTEKADERQDILTGEYILEKLVSADEFGHHANVTDELVEWAQENKHNDDISDDLLNAVYKLSSTEINFGSLFDPTKEFDDPSEMEAEREAAVLKARALMAFCDTTGRRGVYGKAEKQAQQQIESEEEQRKEEQRRKDQAKRVLSDPPAEINNFQLVETPIDEVVAYNGFFNNDPTVIALYKDSEYVRIRAFPHENWEEIDWNMDSVCDYMTDEVYSTPTGSTPETLQEGASQLIDWLNNDWFEFEPNDVKQVNTNY